MATSAYDWINPALETIHRAQWYRTPQPIASPPGAVVTLFGQAVINFASNDYLGLAHDPRLIEAAIAAIQNWGTGATGSRLISGHRELHEQLEQAIARFKQVESALVFSSGYLANLGTISAIVGQRDLILADQYNHSSLKQGAILSGATVMDYPHVQMDVLKQLLHQHRDRYRRCLIVTDSVFSMDGDLCPLPELFAIADDYQAMLLIDEAHATGVMGETGAGCVEHFGCTGQPLIQIGTLSKALGSLGGYVAGSQNLIEFLRNRAATWIYTTGLSPSDTAAALSAIAVIQASSERRSQLWHNVTTLKQRLQDQVLSRPNSGFQLLPSESPILCLQVRDAKTVVRVGQALRSKGCYVGAIRPPTVPTSRLRVSVMATHTQEHLQQLVHSLAAVDADVI
jgi:8-amino-7-oxononanoate synthase